MDILIDGKPVARVAGRHYREDLLIAGIGDGAHAFSYAPSAPIDAAGRVRVVVAGTDIALPRSREQDRDERRERLTRHIAREQSGIEIGPYFNPLAPKRQGYRCLVLDVFDAAALRRQAAADPNVPRDRIADIEEVDLVGPATAIADLVAARHRLGAFDYVLSSHNFEHLADPIRFLQGCQRVLRPGGVLAMAIPDRRACFDYFRPHSVLADLLAAYFARRERPTPAQIFEHNSLNAAYVVGEQRLIGFSLANDPAQIIPAEALREAFDQWERFEARPDAAYRDAHCWTFTPASFELLLSDLAFLGLVAFELIEVSETRGNEFHAHLRNRPPGAEPVPASAFYERRRRLLHRVNDEAWINSARAFEMTRERQSAARRIGELEDRLAAAAARIAHLEAALARLGARPDDPER